MAIKLRYFDEKKKQNGECNVWNFKGFFFGMRSDVPAFPVFAKDFELWIEVNEDIPNQICKCMNWTLHNNSH